MDSTFSLSSLWSCSDASSSWTGGPMSSFDPSMSDSGSSGSGGFISSSIPGIFMASIPPPMASFSHQLYQFCCTTSKLGGPSSSPIQSAVLSYHLVSLTLQQYTSFSVQWWISSSFLCIIRGHLCHWRWHCSLYSHRASTRISHILFSSRKLWLSLCKSAISSTLRMYTDSKSLVDTCYQWLSWTIDYRYSTMSADWDIQQCITTTLRQFEIPPLILHVKGHQDSTQPIDSLSLPVRLNVHADVLAGQYDSEIPITYMKTKEVRGPS